MLILDRYTLEVIEERPFPKEIREGWGITHSDLYIYISDGSNTLFVLDKDDLKVLKKIDIFDEKGTRMMNLNELEYVKDKTTGKEYIYAN